MRVQVTERTIGEVAADAAFQVFWPPASGSVPAWAHMSKNARSVVVEERGSVTWIEGRRMKAPRLALVAASHDHLRAFGWSGSPNKRQRKTLGNQSLRGLGGIAERACFAQDIEHAVLAPTDPPDAIVPVLEGLLLRAHGPIEFIEGECATTLERVTVCVENKKDLHPKIMEVVTLCEATNHARTLADLPANVGTPEEIAKRVSARMAQFGVSVKVLDDAQLRRLGMGLLLAVAKGSSSPPRLLVVEYRPKGKRALPTYVLVGKGLTHDTGGYNLKISNVLHDLTYDKAGGMAVVGALEAVARLNVPAKVIGLVPLVENCIGANAYKPGDILRAMDGTTVYVANTDAEGRLVLADCLTYAQRFEPDAVIDIATLTGASSVALGEPFSSLFSTHDRIRDHLVAAGHQAGELLWPMPIHGIHRGALNHFKAAVRNQGVRGGAACSAAAFLRHFVRYPWAHIDMAGKDHWNADREFLGRGATGWGVRLLTRFVQTAAQTLDLNRRGSKTRKTRALV